MGIENTILQTMYYQGSINMNNNQSTGISFVTMNKDMVIEMVREPLLQSFWTSTNGAKFRCIMRFKDSIGRELLSVDFDEIKASIFLDNANEFLAESSIFDQYLLSNIIYNNDTNRILNISLHTIYNDTYITEPRYQFKIQEYNCITQMSFDRILIEFNDDTLENFISLAFFEYLIDITE